VESWLVLARFLHYGASLVLFGLALFPLYTYGPIASRSAGSRAPTLSLPISVLVLISCILWFISVTTSMTEAEMSWETPRFMLTETSFGAVSLLRLGAATAAVGVLTWFMRGSPRKLELLLAAICAVLLGSLAGIGHTQIADGQVRLVHVLSDALHLLGAGAWLGGLVGLLDLIVVSLSGKNTKNRQACEAALNFSTMGYVAVAILVVSGLINSWFLVSSPINLVTTTYGRLLLLKLVLFALMVGFAGLNRFFVVPALVHSVATGAKSGLRWLLINLAAEQSLGFAIVLIVSLLGITEPATTS
jgi:putative copper resistance protein D